MDGMNRSPIITHAEEKEAEEVVVFTSTSTVIPQNPTRAEEEALVRGIRIGEKAKEEMAVPASS